jgi:SAM-dependent methyltransferase
MPKLTKCYLCGHTPVKKAFKKFGYNILRCPKCELFRLDFQEDYQKFIHEYYNDKFFTGSIERAGYVDYQGDSWPELMNMRRYLTRIRRYKKRGKLLDCGCATGLFLTEAKKAGFSSYGFDVSAYAVRIAKKHGLRVKQATLSKVTYPKQSFDVITLLDVIEHLRDPKTDLKHLGQFLKPGGLLMINTGDAGSVLAQLEGKNWHFFVPPQHLFFFSRKTLTQLLEQAGFKVVRIDYKGKWVSVRYLLNLMKQIQNSTLAKTLYPLVSQNILGKIPLYLNLFDNMVVYAQKES